MLNDRTVQLRIMDYMKAGNFRKIRVKLRYEMSYRLECLSQKLLMNEREDSTIHGCLQSLQSTMKELAD